jgi:hypothetical protein
MTGDISCLPNGLPRDLDPGMGPQLLALAADSDPQLRAGAETGEERMEDQGSRQAAYGPDVVAGCGIDEPDQSVRFHVPAGSVRPQGAVYPV